ncbi:MAG: Ldh family oxidoreductase [Anaerolineae bacterium]|nr:Ldh family oxidoreductase [Anaerolineae bacterium]
MSDKEILIKAEVLEAFVAELFHKAGMSLEDAKFSAQGLVQINLWGVDSHGVLRTPIYIQRLLSGAVNPTPEIKTVNGSLAMEVMDADDAHGFVAGREAMARAIEIAEQFNVGVVGMIRSNHLGALGLYTQMAVERGMIGIGMTNVVPNIVAPGGSKPITGNNPIAVGIPTFGDFPFMLDISLSNVSGGKLLLASKKGDKIPLGWATDKNGHPTDDPDEAFAGFLLPIGGHKGLGLSYMVDILSGLITGGAFQKTMKGMYKYPDDPSLTGHFMLAINIENIISREDMQARMDTFHQTLKESPMWDENQEMMLPGEIEYRTTQVRKENGIPLPPQLYDDLVALGQELGTKQILQG